MRCALARCAGAPARWSFARARRWCRVLGGCRPRGSCRGWFSCSGWLVVVVGAGRVVWASVPGWSGFRRAGLVGLVVVVAGGLVVVVLGLVRVRGVVLCLGVAVVVGVAV